MKDLSNENVVHIKDKDCEYLQFRKLLGFSDILSHAYGLKPANYKTRGDGVTSEIKNTSIENYRKLCASIGIDYNKLVKPNQMHTNNVKVVEDMVNKISVEDEKFRNTDGLVTNLKGVTLATTNADCNLLMFFDPVKKVIANIHSGWRGTFQKIALKGVDTMVQKFECDPKDIICCICPSIRKCHFEVEKDVKDMCVDIFSYTNRIDEFVEYIGVEDGKDKWKIDTILINKILLEEAGLIPENIIDSGICSVCNCENIHSYRVEGKNYGLCSGIITIL